MTAIGWLPEGNTGGTSVSAFRRMPIPPDLQRGSRPGDSPPRRSI
jgi:hypothetical protein